jgi:hypothetical protein
MFEPVGTQSNQQLRAHNSTHGILLDGNNPKGCIHGVLFEKMIANM